MRGGSRFEDATSAAARWDLFTVETAGGLMDSWEHVWWQKHNTHNITCNGILGIICIGGGCKILVSSLKTTIV